MKKEKLILGTLLFLLGIIGVLSMLTMEIPIPEEARGILEAQFTPQQIKLLLLANPTIMLLVAVILGTVFYKKAGLKAPILEGVIGRKEINPSIKDILKSGVLLGVLSGILLTTISLLFVPSLPEEFIALGENLKPSLAVRFLYGGITEEIIMRFGLMTFLVWLCSLIFKGLNSTVYWIGIVIAAFLFALGHFPIVYQSISEPSAVLLSYIIIGNMVGGIVFGWLYWKKGLEAAFIAHIFAHVVMVVVERF
jgi:hypothetical protein